MDTSDGDLTYLGNLAAKYNTGVATTKDWSTVIAIMLLLAGVAFYSTVNAISLQISKYKLEQTLAQYNQQPDVINSTISIPAPYQNISFDFEQQLPNLYIDYINNQEGTCNTIAIELPPTLYQQDSNQDSCEQTSKQEKVINFGGNVYRLNDKNLLSI